MTLTDSDEQKAENSERPSARRISGRPNGRRKLRVRILGLSLAILAGFLIAEICLRFLGIGMPSLYGPDEFCGSRLRASTTGVWAKEGHAQVAINSARFRGEEFQPLPSDGTLRVAVLGDSFVEALQVNERASFCAQMQQMLNVALTSFPEKLQENVEVINCGVSGYGTAQELQLLKHYVLPLKPDVVLLAVFPENDIRNNFRALEQDDVRPYFAVDDRGNLVADMAFRQSEGYLTASSTYEQTKAEVVNRSRVLQLLKHLKGR